MTLNLLMTKVCPMYPCPHCGNRSFGWTAKWLSSPMVPRACRACDQLSCAPGSPAGTLLVVNALVLTLAGFAAAWWHSALPWVVGVGVALVLWVVRVHLQPMVALSRQQVAQARKSGGFGVLLVLIASVMQ